MRFSLLISLSRVMNEHQMPYAILIDAFTADAAAAAYLIA